MEFEGNQVMIVIAILLLLVAGFFGYKYYTDKSDNEAKLNDAFSLGYNKSLIDVAQGQAQTGTIILWVNDTIKVVSLENICGAVK